MIFALTTGLYIRKMRGSLKIGQGQIEDFHKVITQVIAS